MSRLGMNRVVLDRLVGLLLFLPVPVVLVLLTRQPLGTGVSLVAAIALVATHRLYARPWALARASRRCLWCAGAAPAGTAIAIDEPGGRTSWAACGPAHETRVRAFLGWARRRGTLLRVGILGAIALVVGGSALAAGGRLGGLEPRVFGDAFRLVIALLVLPLGWFGPSATPDRDALRAPFPVHLQALVGSAGVAWLFRLIGLYWLVDAGLALSRRAGLF